MTTEKNNAAPHPQPAELADNSVIEQIAQQWDGCQYDALGEMVDIGAAIRRAGKRLSAELAEQQGVSLPPFPRTYYDAFGDGSEPLYTGKQMQDYARAVLAATGKHQAGEVHGDAHVVVLREMRARLTDAGSPARTAALDAAIAALAARQPGAQEPIELSGIADALREGGGFWRTCSGCHESNQGVPTGPYSRVMKCHLGTGCSECGGVGAIWDDTVYQAWSDQIVQSLAAPPAQGIDLGQQQDAARWRAIAPLLSVEWDEDEQLKRWTWIDFKGDAPAIPSPTRQEYASVAEAVDALIDQRDAAPGVGNG